MILTDIRLRNFRSYTDSSFELDPGVNIVIGPNGAGKTNLLEAIILVSGHKNHRGNNLIRNNEQWSRVDVHLDDNSAKTIKLRKGENSDRLDKDFEVKTKKYKRIPFSQKHPVILFEPNNLLIINGEPSLRRKYLDTLLESINRDYSSNLRDYNRALYQRNALLKHHTVDKQQIFVWNLRLAELAEKIIDSRKKLIENINDLIPDKYSKIANKPTKLTLEYVSSVDSNNYSSALLKNLDKSLEADMRQGFTSHGPHRDDIVFWLDGSKFSAVGSRGEVRSLLLSLKMIETEVAVEALNLKPILLLDDVFSELDGSRRKALTTLLKDHQSIITTTDADIVTKSFSQHCQIIPLD